MDSGRWQRALATRHLRPAEGKLDSGQHISATRKEVFDLGDQTPTVDNAFQLLYYSLAWGLLFAWFSPNRERALILASGAHPPLPAEIKSNRLT